MKPSIYKILICILIVTLLSQNMFIQISSANKKQADNESAIETIESNGYIVKFKNFEKGKQSLEKKSDKNKRYQHFKIMKTTLSKEDYESLTKDPNVEYIEPDQLVEVSADIIETHLSQVHAPEAHGQQLYGNGVKVAVLDTGIDKESTELNIAGGMSFVESEPDYDDLNGHGTMVAGILSAAKDDKGLVGVAPNVELYAVKVLDEQGIGSYSQVIAALDWAVENKIDIVSMSFIGKSDSQALREAISYANDNGILLVGAAGNNSSDTVGYPANYESVISVGAVDQYNQLAFFSNRGKVDLVAPGVNISGLSLSQGVYTTGSGTSLAVPQVAGIAALLKQAQPQLSNLQIRDTLISGATPLGSTNLYGHGLVHAVRSLKQLGVEIEEAPYESNQEKAVEGNSSFINLEPVVVTSVSEAVYSDQTSVTDSVYELNNDQIMAAAPNYTPDITLQKSIWNRSSALNQAPFSISSNGENISTLSGGLTIEESDLSLPGRNGLSFTLSRTYDSSSSLFNKEDVLAKIFCLCRIEYDGLQYEERTQDKVTIYENPSSYLDTRFYMDATTDTNGYMSDQIQAVNVYNYILANAGNKRVFASAWSGPDQFGFYTRKVWDVDALPHLSYIDNNTNPYTKDILMGWRTTAWGSTDEERMFPIGKGWTWNIPFIKTVQNKQFLSFPGKGTYEISGNSLKGYSWKDLSFKYDAGISVNSVQSSWVLETLDKKKYYFSATGQLIQISDAYKSAIQFLYSPQGAYGEVLSHIKDDIGNDLAIVYTSDKVVLTLGSKSVTYWKGYWGNWNSGPPFDSRKVESLDAVTNVNGQTTYYGYETKEAKSSLTSSTSLEAMNRYLLLKSISYPTSARTVYEYETTPVNRYSSPSSVNQAYRIKSRAEQLSNGNKFNSVSFTYSGDMGSSYNQDFNFSTTVDNGLLTTKFDYKKDYIDENTQAAFYNTKTTQTQSDSTLWKETSYVYDEARRLPVPNSTSTIAVKGAETSVPSIESRTYDDYGNVVTETNALNVTVQYDYDSTTHLLTGITAPVDETRKLYTKYTRNDKGVVTQTASYEKKSDGTLGVLLSEVNVDEMDPYGNATKIRFSNIGKSTIKSIEYGSQYKYAFPTKEVVTVTNNAGVRSDVIAKYDYDASSGRITTVTDGKGFITSYEYDNLGRITKVTNPAPEPIYQLITTYPEPIYQWITYPSSYQLITYDDYNNIVKLTDETLVTSQVKYNPLGLKQSEGFVESGVYKPRMSYYYDTYGRLDYQEDAQNRVIDYTYDDWGRIKDTQVGTGIGRTEYDDIRFMQTSTDAEGNKVKARYDLLGRTLSTYQVKLDANGQPQDVLMNDLVYDYAGNVTSQKDAKNNSTSYSYDVLGRLVGVKNAKEEETKYSYNLLGLLTKVEYPDHTTEDRDYDELGRIMWKSDQTGDKEYYDYDLNSNLTKLTNRKNVATNFDYDNRNFLKMKRVPSEVISYSYDEAGRRKAMTDGTGTTLYNYDQNTGELKGVNYPDGRQMAYEYDSIGNREKLTDPFGQVQVYSYYTDRNLLKGVGPSKTILDVSYDYNKNGQISTAQFANGTRQSYTYKDADLQSVTHQYAQGTPPFNSYSYEYDNNKNIQSKTTNGQTSSYTYDPLNRIETNSEFSETYTYDSKGNRLSLSSEQTLAINEGEYEYDDWDRLIKVTKSDGSTVTYRYNGDNLLYERTENGQTLRYYWDGDQIAAEATVVGGTPQHKASYIRGNGIVARKASNGTKMYYLTNGHGDVVELRNEDGSIANQYSYDIWGNVLSNSGDAENPFLYSGEYWDEDTKLQYLRARWYDPSMGRFINKDTYEGQIDNPLTLNLYTYTANNPLRYTDPSGHCFTEWLGKSYCKKAWNATKEFVSNIEWGEVGLGLLQATGGGFEVLGGWTLATGGTAASGGLLAGVTITTGGILMVDGSSNTAGGLSRAWNGLMGSKEGDTLNFVKRDIFMKVSPSNGEEYYNYYQLGLGILSLGLSAKSLATESGQILKNANGSYQLTKDGVTASFSVTEGNISKMTITYYTSNGYAYKSVQINTGLMAAGVTDVSQTITNMYFTAQGIPVSK